jgi:hypothetical protein
MTQFFQPDLSENIDSPFVRDVARPAFGTIESDDVHRIVELPGDEIVDDALEARLRFIGLAIGAAGFAKVVEHEMHDDVEIRNEAGG